MTGEHAAPNQARHIIHLLGGKAEAGRILGWSKTKVDSCWRTGFIRCQDHRHVLESAWAVGININQLDFVVHLHGLHRATLTAAA